MFGRIFGTKKAVNYEHSIIDGLDIPDVEKVKLRLELFNRYTAFKMAQRVLALIITLIYVLAMILAAAYHYKGLDYKGVITIISAFELGLVMLSVVSFYVGGGAIASLKDRN